MADLEGMEARKYEISILLSYTEPELSTFIHFSYRGYQILFWIDDIQDISSKKLRNIWIEIINGFSFFISNNVIQNDSSFFA